MSEPKVPEMTGEDFADMADRIRYCYGRYGMDDVADVFDRLQSDLAAARARIAALTTVTEDDVEVVKRTISGLETPMMKGDNLAILLCSVFENADQEVDDETGWTPDAETGYKEVVEAIARAALAAFMARKTK